MKTLVLTGYDATFAPLGDLTSEEMHRYARRHEFDFEAMREGTGPHPSWWKINHTAALFEHGAYDRVIWFDADIVITNGSVVPPFATGYHCSRDWGADATEPWMLSNGCWCAFPDSAPLLRWIIANADAYSKEFHEQEHMRAAAQSGQWPITVHPRRVFNAVPIEVHPSVVEPWQPGDWCAHLTMVPLPRRIELFHAMRAAAPW